MALKHVFPSFLCFTLELLNGVFEYLLSSRWNGIPPAFSSLLYIGDRPEFFSSGCSLRDSYTDLAIIISPDCGLSEFSSWQVPRWLNEMTRRGLENEMTLDEVDALHCACLPPFFLRLCRRSCFVVPRWIIGRRLSGGRLKKRSPTATKYKTWSWVQNADERVCECECVY